MKRLLFYVIGIIICVPVIGQQKATVSKELRNLGIDSKPVYYDEIIKPGQSPYKSPSIVEEDEIGKTFFDLQSNSGMQNRLYLYDDGTIGATFTFGENHPGFDDRGTGYNFFNGSEWGPFPTERIESDRNGWPAYAPFGENGEIVVAHFAGAASEGLVFNHRPEKGTGDWTEFIFEGPEGSPSIAWPRITTSGPDNSVVHLITITLPTANGGSVYQGQDGALLYSRSSDGGTTWEIEHHLFEELNVDNYVAFDGDTYEIQAQGDNIAILIGEPWIDMILMKSTDGGDTWTKTVIWENPYPMWNTGTVTDTFFCVDGSHSLAFDPDGMVHIAFGINRALSEDGTAQSWFPFVDGVGYWNESMPVFSNNINALDPYGHPDSELIDDYNLIGWSQDMDGDGEITFVGNTTDNIGTYQLGLSSMPQIHVDETGLIFVVWSSVTETYDNGLKNYRHLWARVSPNGIWWAPFYHLTDDIIHIFDESVWPALSVTSDDMYWYLLFQIDSEPGLAVRFDEHGYVQNTMQFMKIEKYPVGVSENQPKSDHYVSKNYPNPFSGITTIRLNIEKPSSVELDVFTITGQLVYHKELGKKPAGEHKIKLDGSQFEPGTYFFKMIVDKNETIRKMIVN
jgi:hypothetical protein